MRKPARKPRPRPYTVGKGRPPMATRWKPGQSGNPKGRPKGARSIGAVLDNVLRQKVTVTENGKARRIPVLEAMVLRLVNDALRSVPSAVKLLLSIIERHGESPDAELRPEDLAAEDRAILARYLGTPLEPNAEQAHNSDDEDDNDR
jgi:Family of unknown function (DUF5681)